jgi:hypothetical protein
MSENHPAQDFLLKELEYRREKQWRIFSWAAGLSAAIIGIVVSDIAPDPQKGPISYLYRAALSLALATIAYYGLKWLDHNWECEKSARNHLQELQPPIMPKCFFAKPEPQFGYEEAIMCLLIVGLLALWLAPISCWVQTTFGMAKHSTLNFCRPEPCVAKDKEIVAQPGTSSGHLGSRPGAR